MNGGTRWIFQQAQIRGRSIDGKNAVTEDLVFEGLRPGSLAHLFLTGWSFKFSSGDHPILEVGIWLQQKLPNQDWNWAHQLNVDNHGVARARYVGFIGSENRDNPFEFLINYALMGEAP